MALQLATGVMKYRSSSSDSWHPIIMTAIPESGALLCNRAQTWTAAQLDQYWENLGLTHDRESSLANLNYETVT